MTPSSSSSSSSDRPHLPPLTRLHSRSSSQLATFAALALSPVSANPASLPFSATAPPGSPRRTSGAASPRLTGSGTFSASPGSSRATSRRASMSSDSSEDAKRAEEGKGEEEEGRGRTDSGSTAPTSTSSTERTPQALKDHRSTFPSLSSSLTLPALTSTSPSPVNSPAVPSPSLSSPGSTFPNPVPQRSLSASPNLLPSNPLSTSTAAQSSFSATSASSSTSSSLAQFIQHKRRQASAPYLASARDRSLFSPGAGFSLGPSSLNAGGGEFVGGWGSGVGATGATGGGGDGEGSLPPSRSRSRASSRRGTASGLHLQTGGLLLGVPSGEAEDPQGLVVTPTTEEWRVLGEELVDLKRERRRTGGGGSGAGGEGKVTRLSGLSGFSGVTPTQANLTAVEREVKGFPEEEGMEKEDEGEKEEAVVQQAEKARSPVKPRWKRWPSLHDESDSEEEDEEDDSSDDADANFALSLSLSRYNKFKPNAHQLPHTPPPHPLPISPPRPSSPAEDAPPTRPTVKNAYKSSFGFSSSLGGANGGFTSHSNTNSISSLHAPLSSSSSTFSPADTALPASSSSSSTNPPSPRRASAPNVVAPGSDPLPHAETFSSSSSHTPSSSFTPSHSQAARNKSESGITFPSSSSSHHPSHHQHLAHHHSFSSTSFPSPVSSPGLSHLASHLHRPALSRGSLSSTTGGLSSPSPNGGSPAGSVGMSPGLSGDSLGGLPVNGNGGEGEEGEREEGEDGETRESTPRRAGEKTPPPGPLGRIPIPPSVFRSLEQGEMGERGSGESGGSTPLGFARDGEVEGVEANGGVARPALVGGGGGGGNETPLTEAPTPYDGDPFSSLAPSSSLVPPTPGFFPPSQPSSSHLPSSSSSASSAPAAQAQPVDLNWSLPLGPVDPRTYSAVTGLRDIGSFVVEGDEAGRGAYGSVTRARERGRDGKGMGPPLIVKYVIKQRILADCWKKHKILGPIPIEVHVLDHLRRVPYTPRPHLRYLSSRRGGGGEGGGGGRKVSIVRRDSAPKLDLWKGGEDGGAVRTGHPGVCPLLDFFETAEHYMLIMPQATASPLPPPSPSSSSSAAPQQQQGQDLFDYVDAHPNGLAPAEIYNVLKQLTDAVCFLHDHSIVHRDIKDENVVLDPSGTVRLIDFGSAAYVKEGRKFDTFSGTLDFAAPEVLRGARYGGKEQDIWALGVLGYVLVCGECPFWSPDEAMRGLSPDTRAHAALLSKLQQSSSSSSTSLPPSPTSPAPPALTGALRDTTTLDAAIDLVRRCLEIDPLARPTADMVCDHEFLAGEEGWRGYRGWEKVEMGEEEGEEE
ncbi:hypothetical protein JCM8547_002676 [Rhodosporidiobolus lusitaniae]